MQDGEKVNIEEEKILKIGEEIVRKFCKVSEDAKFYGTYYGEIEVENKNGKNLYKIPLSFLFEKGVGIAYLEKVDVQEKNGVIKYFNMIIFK